MRSLHNTLPLCCQDVFAGAIESLKMAQDGPTGGADERAGDLLGRNRGATSEDLISDGPDLGGRVQAVHRARPTVGQNGLLTAGPG